MEGAQVLDGSPILALTLMAAAMIAAAVSGRMRSGLLMAGLGTAGLIVLAGIAGLSPPAHPLWALVAVSVASVSFAARGVLFARSSGRKGWLIAVFVVAGEAAVLLTSTARPGLLPDWLLALLPAQWANIAIRTAMAGTSPGIAIAALLALGGTAAATLLVARLWPRRWPYLVIFTTWLALSALVWLSPAPPEAVMRSEGLERVKGTQLYSQYYDRKH